MSGHARFYAGFAWFMTLGVPLGLLLHEPRAVIIDRASLAMAGYVMACAFWALGCFTKNEAHVAVRETEDA